MTDYSYNKRGGSAQTLGGLVSFRLNGTLGQIITFPENSQKRCLHIETGLGTRFEISGCVGQESILLYVTSFIGNKPFAMSPFETEANNLLKLQVVNELLILVDTEEDPYRKSQRGGIFIYEISGDDESEEPLIQLEYLSG